MDLFTGSESKAPLYQPLVRDEIRLFTVFKVERQGLVCRLDTYPRSQAPEFDALSYCWGESLETTTIVCNETELPIRTSLYSALRQLITGSARPVRPLWIDAVCLNQRDEDEKAHQVPRMCEVYQLAARTLVWLGDTADGSDEALKFLQVLDQDIQIDGYSQDVEDRVALLETDQGSNLLDSIRALTRRSWFSRVWTVQELVLSKNCAIVCGDMSLQWAAFVTFDTALRHFGVRRILITASKPFPLAFPQELAVDVLEKLRLILHAHQNVQPGPLLDVCESKECVEPVDRIWGILALLPESLRLRIEESGIIDYSDRGKREYWRSYLGFMKLLYLHNWHAMWNVTAEGQGLAKNPQLPSWCPDFNGKRCYSSLADAGDYRAGFRDSKIDTAPRLRLSPESEMLGVNGFTIDAVQSVTRRVAPQPRFTRDGMIEGMEEWLQECYPLVYQVLGISQKAVVTLCRTLKAKPPSPNSSDSEKQKWDDVVQEATLAYEAWHCGSAAVVDGVEGRPWCWNSSRLAGRKFFNTVQGRIGLCGLDVRSGDQVCVFTGGQLVYILRKLDRDTVRSSSLHAKEDLKAHSELYSLIGDAYIDGCMMGEAFTTPGRGPDREFVLA